VTDAEVQATKSRTYDVLLRRALQLAAHFGTGCFTEYLWLDMDKLSEHWLSELGRFSSEGVTAHLAKWLGEREKTFDQSKLTPRSAPALPNCILGFLADHNSQRALAKALFSDTVRDTGAR
jgi:hypothetical protein